MTPYVCDEMRAMYSQIVCDTLIRAENAMFNEPRTAQALEVVMGGIVDGVQRYGKHINIPLIPTLTSILIESQQEPEHE